jgi:hypothetical protein
VVPNAVTKIKGPIRVYAGITPKGEQRQLIRKPLFTAVIVCALLLLAFAVPASARAETIRWNEREPFDFVYPVYLCNEPVVMEEGDLHFLRSARCNSAGGCSLSETRFLKATGEGESTGLRYHYRLRTVIKNTQKSTDQANQIEKITIMLIGQGRAENLVLHCQLHWITNAHGEVTATHLECQRKDCESLGLG